MTQNPQTPGEPTSQQLAALVEQARRGDLAARDRLVTMHLPDLERFLRHLQGAAPPESTSDLVQSVCREALAGIDRFEYRGPESLRHWLFRAAQNKLIDRFRYHGAAARDRTRQRAMDGDGSAGDLGIAASGPGPGTAAMSTEQRELLQRAVAQLPDDQRRVVELVSLAGHSHADAARIMGRSEQASRALLSRALVALSRRLDAAT